MGELILDEIPETGHFKYMNKLLERSHKSCSKFANDLQVAEKDLRNTALDRDRWKARAEAAETKLASLGYL